MNRISRRKLIKFVVASQVAGLAGVALRAPGYAQAKRFGVAGMPQSKSVTGAAGLPLVEARKGIQMAIYSYIP